KRHLERLEYPQACTLVRNELKKPGRSKQDRVELYRLMASCLYQGTRLDQSKRVYIKALKLDPYASVPSFLSPHAQKFFQKIKRKYHKKWLIKQIRRPPVPKKRRRKTVFERHAVSIILFGVGAAALGTGIVLGVASGARVQAVRELQQQDNSEADAIIAAQDSAYALGASSTALVWVGGASIAGGFIALLVELQQPKQAQTE
ncbi:MAG: hypothetical protein AAGJ35_06955, partial [Myxococcota bacterium]